MVQTRRMQAAAAGQEAPDDSMSALLSRMQAIPAAEYTPVSQVGHAAVLVPLFEDASGTVQVLLTQRADSLSTHAAEVALPGGKRDEADASNVETALREAHEELGLRPEKVQVLRSMRPVLSKHLLSVVPVIGVIAADAAQEALQSLVNPAEVQRVFAMPLLTFLQRKGHSSREATFTSGASSGKPKLDIRYRLHYFEVEDLPICWGLTAGILIEVAKMALGWEPDFNEQHPDSSSYATIWHNGIHVAYRE